MYKETLDILMEDINDHNNIKENLLKNQLRYHFTNKNKENKDVMDSAAVIVRRMLRRLPLNEIIGFQPIMDKDDPFVLYRDVEYNIDIIHKPLQIRFSDINSSENFDLKTMYGLDINTEIIYAASLEIETEIVTEFLNLISEHATEMKIEAKVWEIDKIINAIISTVNDIDLGADWIIVSPLIVAILQSDKTRFESDLGGHGTIGELQQVGWLNVVDNIPVYCSLWNQNDTILVGWADTSIEETPIIYAPETMIMVDNKQRDTLASKEYTQLSTRYGKYVNVEDAKARYRKLSINFGNNG